MQLAGREGFDLCLLEGFLVNLLAELFEGFEVPANLNEELGLALKALG